MRLRACQAGGRGEIEALQLARLRELLGAIVPGNRFYAEKLGDDRGWRQAESLDDFSRLIPYTFKSELIEDQSRHPPYGTDLTYPAERYSRFSQTSGTTGTPMRWLDTTESWDWMIGNWTRVLRAAGVSAKDRVFFAFGFGPFLGFWVAFDAAARLGCLCLPGGGMRSAARLRVMLDNAATVLCCTPTYALRLAEVAAEEKVDLRAASVRTIIVSGEPGGGIAGTRERIEHFWNGARVVDHHGMTEVGPVSYGCPERNGVLHVIESSYFAEVIDPATGRAVEPGARGELVLTTLGRFGSPLLRYRTGDIVERDAQDGCACGSFELALPGGILRRVDDMFIVRGVNVYPSAIEDILRKAGGIAEYRVEVHRGETGVDIRIQVEPEAGDTGQAGFGERVEQALYSALGLRIDVVIVDSGTLPRFELKASRWVR